LLPSFPIHSGLKHGYALSALPLSFNPEHVIEKENNTNLGLDMNGTHQVLAYADNVNLLGVDIRTIKGKVEILFIGCNYIGLAINTRKTKYMEVGRHQGMMEDEHIKEGSNSYEIMITFNYFGSLKNQNSIH
jgi:hypothetical protein